MNDSSPESQIAAIENQAERLTTASGDGTMVWRRWAAKEPASARPVIFLHGGSGSWRHWIRNIEPLRRTFDKGAIALAHNEIFAAP